MRQFDQELSHRLQVEVINKVDLLTEEEIAQIDALAKAEGREVFFISAKEGIGIEKLVRRMWELRNELDMNEALIRYQEEEVDEEEEFPEIEVTYVRG